MNLKKTQNSTPQNLNNFSNSEAPKQSKTTKVKSNLQIINEQILNDMVLVLDKPFQQNDNQKYFDDLGFINGEDLMLHFDSKLPMLVDNLLPRTGIAVLYGSSDTGKTTLLIQLALSISDCNEFLGFKVNAVHKKSIIVVSEDNPEAINEILHSQKSILQNVKAENLRLTFDSENIVQKIESQLQKDFADLIILDCFGDLFCGDLKDSSKVRQYIQQFHNIAIKHNCLVLFLHHSTKSAEYSIPHKNNLNSGQGLEAKTRIAIELVSDKYNLGKKHLCITKGNFLKPEDKSKSYVLDFGKDKRYFENTGERLKFDEIKPTEEMKAKKDNYFKALELKEKKMTYDDIAEVLGLSNKGRVTDLIKLGSTMNW